MDVYRVMWRVNADKPFDVKKVDINNLQQDISDEIALHSICARPSISENIVMTYIDIESECWSLSNDNFREIVNAIKELNRNETIDTILK